MGTTIRELFVKLGIDADTKAVAQFDSGINQVSTGMADLARIGLIAAAAVATVVAGMVAGTVVAAAYGDEIGKSAKQIGIGAEELQKWRFAADRSGVSTEELAIGLKTLTRNMQEARTGVGPAAEAFAEFGIEVENADGTLKSQTQLLAELADAYNEMEDPVKRAALLQDIFGKSGAALGPLLAEGAEGIEELMQRAEDLGLIMSEEGVQASEDFTDSMTDLTAIITGMRNKIALFLMPAIGGMINRFVEWFVANREIIDQKAEEFFERVASVLESIPKRAKAVVDFFGGLEVILAALVATGSALIGGFFSLKVLVPVVSILSGLFTIITAIGTALGVGLIPVIALLVIGVGLLAQFFAALAIPVGLVILLIQDLYTFIQGGDSVLGLLLEKLGLGEQAFKTFWAAMAVGRDLLMALWDLHFALASLMGAILVPAIKGVSAALAPLFNLFLKFVGFVGGKALTAIMALVKVLEKAAQLINIVSGGVDDISGNGGGGGDPTGGRGNPGFGSDAGRGNSNRTNNNTVNQNNSIAINGAGDPGAVGTNVVGELDSMLNQASASFDGSDI